MKIAGGLTIILVLGGLESLSALAVPSSVGAGAGVDYDEKKGVSISKKTSATEETHEASETGGDTYSEGQDGSESDSQHHESHQKDEQKKKSQTDTISFGGTESDGVQYDQTKENSGSSKQTDTKHSRKHEKNIENSGDGTYRREEESETEEGSRDEKASSYENKESNSMKLGSGGLKKGKTEKSEHSKNSETNDEYSRKRASSEETSHQGGHTIKKKSKSEGEAESHSGSGSETSKHTIESNNEAGESKRRRKRHANHPPGNNNQFANNRNGHERQNNYGSEQGQTSNNNGHYNSGNENQNVQGNRNEQRNSQNRNGYRGSENRDYNSGNANRYSNNNGGNRDARRDNNFNRREQENHNQHKNQSGGKQYGSRNGNNRSGNNNNYPGNANNGANHGNYRSGNGQRYSGNENNKANHGNYRSGNANRYSGNENNGAKHGNYRSGNGQRYSGNQNNGANHGNYRSGNANHYSQNKNNGANHGNYRSNDLNQRDQRSAGSKNGNYGSRNGNYRYGNSNHRYGNSNYRYGNSNYNTANYGNQNYGANRGNYRSRNTNHYSTGSNRGNYGNSHGRYRSGGANNYYGTSGNRNQGYNNGYRYRNRNQYPVNSGPGNYESSNRRNVNQYYRRPGYGNHAYQYGNYRPNNRNNNYGGSRSWNTGRNRNYRYGNRYYGNRNYGYGNGYRGYRGQNNVYAHAEARSGVNGYQNGYHQVPPHPYRQGVKHDDVLKYLSSNGQRVPDRHYEHYEGYKPGYHGHDYPRRDDDFCKGILRGIDSHNIIDGTHYTTGNGRYVLKPGKDGEHHCYYDTETGNYHHIHRITLDGDKVLIIPGNYINSTSNEKPEVGHGYYGRNPYEDGLVNIRGCFPYNIGSDLFYCGDGTYKYKDEKIPCKDIKEYCKSHEIKNTTFTPDGYPDCLFNEKEEGILGSTYFPIDLGQNLSFIGYGHYRHNDKIIPCGDIDDYVKKVNLNITIRGDGLPASLFDGTLGSGEKPENGTSCVHEHEPEYRHDHEHEPEYPHDHEPEPEYPHDHEHELLDKTFGCYPYDLGSDLFYRGDDTYSYHDEIVPCSDIVKFCESHDIKNTTFTYDGHPDCLFNDTADGMFPIDLGKNLSFIGHGHYSCNDQIIPAVNIKDTLKKLDLDIPITEEGIPHSVLDEILGKEPDENYSPHDSDSLEEIYGNYPVPCGSDLWYLHNGTYKYHDEEIPRSDIDEYCKSHEIKNTSFTKDGYPKDLFKDTDSGKFPIDLGNNIFFLGHAHYNCNDQIIPASDIKDTLTKLNIDIPISEDGIALPVFDAILGKEPNEHFNLHDRDSLEEIYGIYPVPLGSDLWYCHNGTYKYHDEEIPRSDIDEYCKSHEIKNISFTKEGYPEDLFKDTDNGKFPIDLGNNLFFLGGGHYNCNDQIIPASEIKDTLKTLNLDIPTNEDGIAFPVFDAILGNEFEPDKRDVFPYDLGNDLFYLGEGSYKYKNETIPSSNITDFCKSHNIDMKFTDDGIPLDFADGTKNFDYNSEDKECNSIDLGNGLFYTDGKYIYENETIPTDKISDFCKDHNMNNITFTEDGHPELGKAEPPPQLDEPSNCPKGPVDLGEGITYEGDCNYMYQDHLISSKYILGLLNILHIRDIELPVGPHDDYTADKVPKDTSNDKEKCTLDLGYDVSYLGNGTYKYKDRLIPSTYYLDCLDILGLKSEPDCPEKLMKDDTKSEKSENEILTSIDELLASKYDEAKDCEKTTDTQEKNTNEEVGSEKQETSKEFGHYKETKDKKEDDCDGNSKPEESKHKKEKESTESHYKTQDEYGSKEEEAEKRKRSKEYDHKKKNTDKEEEDCDGNSKTEHSSEESKRKKEKESAEKKYKAKDADGCTEEEAEKRKRSKEYDHKKKNTDKEEEDCDGNSKTEHSSEESKHKKEKESAENKYKAKDADGCTEEEAEKRKRSKEHDHKKKTTDKKEEDCDGNSKTEHSSEDSKHKKEKESAEKKYKVKDEYGNTEEECEKGKRSKEHDHKKKTTDKKEEDCDGNSKTEHSSEDSKHKKEKASAEKKYKVKDEYGNTEEECEKGKRSKESDHNKKTTDKKEEDCDGKSKTEHSSEESKHKKEKESAENKYKAKDEYGNTVEESEKGKRSKESDHNKKSTDKKEEDCDGNSKSEHSSEESKHKKEKESTESHQKTQDEDGNTEEHHEKSTSSSTKNQKSSKHEETVTTNE